MLHHTVWKPQIRMPQIRLMTGRSLTVEGCNILDVMIKTVPSSALMRQSRLMNRIDLNQMTPILPAAKELRIVKG